jgi:chromosomal replication initiation ATPase DnaA
MDRAAVIADLTFDHRASIVRYMDEQASKLASCGRRDEATLLRATASSISAKIDIEPGKAGIASPVDAICLEVCSNIGGAMLRDILSKDRSESAMRCYFGTVWVAKKRLGWSNESIGDHLDRDASTISHALKRAEEIRAGDAAFRKITEELTSREIRCEHCQHPLLHQAPGGN